MADVKAPWSSTGWQESEAHLVKCPVCTSHLLRWIAFDSTIAGYCDECGEWLIRLRRSGTNYVEEIPDWLLPFLA